MITILSELSAKNSRFTPGLTFSRAAISHLARRIFPPRVPRMFGELLKGLMAPDPAPLRNADARLALSALLVRVARSDGNYALGELTRIDRILAARYELSPFEAAALRSKGEILETEAPDTVRFTRAIKEAVDYDHRIAVIEALWEVALADGHRDDEEASILRMVASFLGVSDQESNVARRKVQARETSK